MNRRLLWSSIALFVFQSAQLPAKDEAPVASSVPVVLAGDRCTVAALPGGSVQVRDRQGKPLLDLDGLIFSWSPAVTGKGEVLPKGDHAVVVRYETQKALCPGYEVKATVQLLPRDRIDLHMELLVPEKQQVGGAMFRRRLAGKAGENGTVHKIGWWTRHEHGGVPFEDRGPVVWQYDLGDLRVFEQLSGNVNWRNGYAQHLSFKTDPERPAPDGWKALEGGASFLVADSKVSAIEAAAVLDGRPLTVQIDCPQPFHLWEGGKSGIPHCAVRIANPSTEEHRSLPVSVWVRDFDGKVRFETQRRIDLAAGDALTIPVQFEAAEPRNIFFVEAAAGKGKKEVFCRTTLGILPPHEYQARNPIMGLAAAFPIPSLADVDRLKQRMGVYYLRAGDDRDARKLGMRANWHNNVKRNQFADDPTKKTETLEKWLRECDERGNEWWEFGNEWNMSKLNSGQYADVYVRDWLVPLAAARQRIGAKVKIQSMGLAGPDTAFLEAIHANGGWPLLDALAIHPGRGNYTADFVGGDYWTFLGCVRRVKEVAERLGPKPIWVTEAYACTKANNQWCDTMRHAAENTVLSYALGVSEGLSTIMFYQLHDSVWHNKGGVNPDDREYDFGILHRDGAVKTVFFAYCAIAEALDGATFRRELTFPDPQTKGLAFDTPRGSMAVLWNRADGYVLNGEKSKTYAAPEPWIDPWKTKTRLSLPATGTVALVDCIGRRTEVQPADGQVSITLDGAPRIAYGLSLDGE